MAPSWISKLAVGLLATAGLLSPASAQTYSDGNIQTPSTLVSITSRASSVASASAAATVSAASNGTASEPKEHYIKVGSGGYKLDPDSISNVSVGDTVTFEFFPSGHSIIRAAYGSACVPFEYTARDRIGFYSGPMMIDKVSDTVLWSITINSTEPIFYYCGADTSCDIQLMVGVINPNSTQTLTAQKVYAQKADWKLIPGDPIPSEGQSTLAIPTSTPTATATAAATPTPSPAAHAHGLSSGAIAGIVVGAVALLAICAALFFYVGRAKSLKETIKRQDDAAAARASANPEMSQYGLGSPGLHSPYGSPDLRQTDYYGNQLPAYGQYHAADARASGWTSPSLDPQHASVGSGYEGLSQQQLDELKQQQQITRVELHSPTPGQGQWAHELEAARGQK
ncbi:hypothetical protein P153DRAFT_30543 [Dothidotthia symphoricarpi CBS 119687]|uniref:Cupredoxin n=1 Tax=Dothidotthia symphoricarpi CBS 119687 TaxID=1392245 RepID=A0A6A6ABS9_9PLEO|nr:uncharacterized protein P153DRAFT_30543 [Dothidotthia symphoricarpi CBS 119687]KAF2129036.1 hypothetical protein P153DRAFT_30543 [Dothidotthia symphoricarpi CBS 119687]